MLLATDSSRIRSRVLALAICTALMPPAFAAEETIDDILVTANRIEQPRAKVGDAVTVLDAETVRASQKTSLAELLSTTVGVTMSRNGGPGAAGALRIRGAESDQTVVLIDGVKLNDPSSPGGGYNFGNLLTSDFARVEVLRGPQSTLWGSQAIGGVINIVTPLPQGPLSGEVSAEGGSRDTALVRARVESGNDRYAWRVGGNYLTTDGVSALAPEAGGREDDGYRNVGFHARGIYHLTDNADLEVRSNWNRGRTEFDGYTNAGFSDTDQYGYTEEWVSYAGVSHSALDGRLRNRVGFSYTDTDRDDYSPAAFVPHTYNSIGRNERWEYQGSWEANQYLTTVFGAESERSKMRITDTYAPPPNQSGYVSQLDSAYLQFSLTPIEVLNLTAGLRYDDHDTYGDHTTARFSAAWALGENTTLRANYGEGFKAPTLYQLYSPYGNLQLNPEEAEGWDAGIEQRLFADTLTLSATYFERDTTNMMDFFDCFLVESPECTLQPYGYYVNTQKTKADGVELALQASLGERANFSANYTHMEAKNATPGHFNFGNLLARRPKETANAQLSYAWPADITTTAAVQYVGSSFDNAGNTVDLDSYTLVDLRAAWQVTQSLELIARIENLFDETYETAAGYGVMGRTAYAGLRQRF